MSNNELPKVTHSGTIKIMGKELKFHQLDNGKRIIEEESFYDFLEIFNSDSPMSESEINDLAKMIKG